MKLLLTGLVLALLAFQSSALACEEFTPKGKLLLTQSSPKFTDHNGKAFNLSVLFKSYDEDGDGRADFETVTRVYGDTGSEAFPYLYYKGKDVLFNDDPQNPTYTLDREFEYLDVNATGVCENIILTWQKNP